MKHSEKEKILAELNQLKLLADVSNNRMNNFQDDLAAALTDAAFKHFGELKDMEADDIRAFGKLVSKHTWSIAAELDRLRYKVSNKC